MRNQAGRAGDCHSTGSVVRHILQDLGCHRSGSLQYRISTGIVVRLAFAADETRLRQYGDHIARIEEQIGGKRLIVRRDRGGNAVADLSRYGATALFLARARAARPRMRLSEPQAEAIGEICRRLDGLPLAIELAAAQLKYESPASLRARMRSRFDVLVGGARDLPAQQQTMGDCLTWGYDLLSEEERTALCTLAVFVGGWTLEAADYALSTVLSAPALAVRSLVDKSHVVVTPRDEGETRFDLLETIREYALERLEERGRASTFPRSSFCQSLGESRCRSR